MSADENARFIQAALQQKLVTKEQVEECQKAAATFKEMGVSQPIAHILVKKGYLTPSQAKGIFNQIGAADKSPIPGFEIQAKLGEGELGPVYRAKQTAMDRMVALRVFPASLAGNVQALQRFNNIAKTAARLSHPNLVGLINAGETAGIHYIALEYVEGNTLADILKTTPRLSEKASLSMGLQIAKGLEAAESVSLFHGNLTPRDIIVTGAGIPKILGIGTSAGTITSSKGAAMEPPYYTAPEAATRGAKLDIRSDIYSLGIILFQVLTGQLPFTGGSPLEIMKQHLQKPAPSPQEYNSSLSEGTNNLMAAMLEKSPDSRIATANQLVVIIQKTLDTLMKGPAQELMVTAQMRTSQIRGAVAPQLDEDFLEEEESHAKGGGKKKKKAKKVSAPAKSRAGLWAVIAIVIILIIGGVGFWLLSPEKPVDETVEVVLTPPPTETDKDVKENMVKANKAYEDEDYETAEELINKILEKDPEHQEAKDLLETCQQQTGLEKGKKNKDRMRKFLEYKKKKQFKEAEEVMSQLLKKYPLNRKLKKLSEELKKDKEKVIKDLDNNKLTISEMINNERFEKAWPEIVKLYEQAGISGGAVSNEILKEIADELLTNYYNKKMGFINKEITRLMENGEHDKAEEILNKELENLKQIDAHVQPHPPGEEKITARRWDVMEAKEDGLADELMTQISQLKKEGKFDEAIAKLQQALGDTLAGNIKVKKALKELQQIVYQNKEQNVVGKLNAIKDLMKTMKLDEAKTKIATSREEIGGFSEDPKYARELESLSDQLEALAGLKTRVIAGAKKQPTYSGINNKVAQLWAADDTKIILKMGENMINIPWSTEDETQRRSLHQVIDKLLGKKKTGEEMFNYAVFLQLTGNPDAAETAFKDAAKNDSVKADNFLAEMGKSEKRLKITFTTKVEATETQGKITVNNKVLGRAPVSDIFDVDRDLAISAELEGYKEVKDKVKADAAHQEITIKFFEKEDVEEPGMDLCRTARDFINKCDFVKAKEFVGRNRNKIARNYGPKMMQSIKQFEQAEQFGREGKYKEARDVLAVLRNKKGVYEQACKTIERKILSAENTKVWSDTGKTPGIMYCNNARFLINQGMFKKADDYLKENADKIPNYGPKMLKSAARFLQVEELGRKGDYEKAQEIVTELKNLNCCELRAVYPKGAEILERKIRKARSDKKWPDDDAALMENLVEVAIESEPIGAIVEIGAYEYGPTPVKLFALAGEKLALQISMPEYQSKHEEFVPEKGENLKSYTLEAGSSSFETIIKLFNDLDFDKAVAELEKNPTGVNAFYGPKMLETARELQAAKRNIEKGFPDEAEEAIRRVTEIKCCAYGRLYAFVGDKMNEMVAVARKKAAEEKKVADKKGKPEVVKTPERALRPFRQVIVMLEESDYVGANDFVKANAQRIHPGYGPQMVPQMAEFVLAEQLAAAGKYDEASAKIDNLARVRCCALGNIYQGACQNFKAKLNKAKETGVWEKFGAPISEPLEKQPPAEEKKDKADKKKAG